MVRVCLCHINFTLGEKLTIVSLEEDPLDRELQSKELARIMAASYPRPVVFLGYVISKPLAPRRMFLLLIVFDWRLR